MKLGKILTTISFFSLIFLSSGIITQAQAQDESQSEMRMGRSGNNAINDGVQNFQEVDDTTFDQLNPLKVSQGGDAADQEARDSLSTPGGIISRVLLFAFPLAGLILFVMIVWGGFETIMQSAGKKSVEAGRQRITAAVIGFVLLFVSIWIIRVVETIFGIKVLFF